MDPGPEAYATYAAHNNVQFSSKDEGSQPFLGGRGTTPHAIKRSRHISNLNDDGFEASTYAAEGQPDLETLGKFFGNNNNATSPSGEASGASAKNHAVDFSIAH